MKLRECLHRMLKFVQNVAVGHWQMLGSGVSCASSWSIAIDAEDGTPDNRREGIARVGKVRR